MPSTSLYGRACGLVFAFVALASAAEAQPGVRAAGLAGAFVAVADDASSIYWNPAGMATGAFVSFVVDYGDTRATPDSPDSPDGGFEQGVRTVAFTLPPLGVGYYRLGTVVAGPLETAETGSPDREEGRRIVHRLATSHTGVTLAHSINRYLVVAGTVKYVRGEVSSGLVTGLGAEEALEAAGGLPEEATSRADVDAGAMMAVEQLRLGVVARNLTRPSFDEPGPDGGELTLDREVRAGAAWGSGWPGISRLVVSADADITRQASPTGDRRDVAAGVETWWLEQRLAVRGGVRSSTVGESRTVVATGISAGVSSGLFVEAQVSSGQARERSWSVGARYTF